MVSDIDDVGRAINRMKKAEVPIVFGLGRHEPSGSIFLYFLDPDGMTTEYSFGLAEFEEEDARPRSEERRVGKEWASKSRSRRSPAHYKKNDNTRPDR